MPRLIDEWQEVPALWDAVRYKVDQSSEKGQFILTGSATPNHKGILHSGAGRIAKLRMRPMSLYESGDSSGKVSLEKLCHGELAPVMTGDVYLRKLIELILRGGWPGSLGLPLEQAMLLPAEYLNAVIDDDVYRIGGVKRDTHKMRLLLRSLARNESTTVTNKTLMKDIKAVDDEDIDGNTVAAYQFRGQHCSVELQSYTLAKLFIILHWGLVVILLPFPINRIMHFGTNYLLGICFFYHVAYTYLTIPSQVNCFIEKLFVCLKLCDAFHNALHI